MGADERDSFDTVKQLARKAFVTKAFFARHSFTFPLILMRKLLIAVVIAVIFGGGWGIMYYILG